MKVKEVNRRKTCTDEATFIGKCTEHHKVYKWLTGKTGERVGSRAGKDTPTQTKGATCWQSISPGTLTVGTFLPPVVPLRDLN